MIFGLVAATVALVGFLGPWGTGLIDLGVYRMGAQALLRGDDIYVVRQPGTGLLFTYPVFAALVFVPVGLVPEAVARVVMTIGSLAGLFVLVHLSVLAFRQATGRSRTRVLRYSVPITVVCLALHPVWDTFNFGQVNLILAAMVLLDILVVASPRWRGVLVGIAAGIKLVPGLFILYYVVTGQRRAAITSALTTVATMVIGLLVAPGPSWDFWTKHAFSPERTGAVYYAMNQSILGAVSRLLRNPEPPRALTYLLAVLAVAVALFAANRLYRRGETLMSVTVVAVAALLASPISWSHHWVWAIPALSTVAGWAATSPPPRQWRWWVFAVATAIVIVGPVLAPKGGENELHHTVAQQALANVYFFLGVVYLGWALVRALRAPDRAPLATSAPASRS